MFVWQPLRPARPPRQVGTQGLGPGPTVQGPLFVPPKLTAQFKQPLAPGTRLGLKAAVSPFHGAAFQVRVLMGFGELRRAVFTGGWHPCSSSPPP